MAHRKTDAQLAREVREFLGSAPTPNDAERAWARRDRERHERKQRGRDAHSKTVTATPYNIWALGFIAHGRKEFPNRLSSDGSRHIVRCVKAGLVEIVGTPRGRQKGDRLRITPFGYESIMDWMATEPLNAISQNPVLPPIGAYTTEVYGRHLYKHMNGLD